MTAEYLFIVDSAKLDLQIRPAIHDVAERGSTRRIRKLIREVIKKPSSRRNGLRKLDRLSLSINLIDVSVKGLLSRSRASSLVEWEIAPQVFEHLCLREIVPRQTTWDISHAKGLQ